jgi:uncharacterized protein YprB with RNaseH-like and TPR domain
MKVEPKDFLRFVEGTKTIVFLDIESTGLKGDYNSAIVAAIKPFNAPCQVNVVKTVGIDEDMLKQTKGMLEQADCWVTYYGKGFDIPFLNTRLLRWGLAPIEKRPHIDMYFMLKSNTLTGRRSQAHLLSWLRTPEQKMTVSADDWNTVVAGDAVAKATLVQRCKSDVKGLEGLYVKTKHLIRDINR